MDRRTVIQSALALSLGSWCPFTAGSVAARSAHRVRPGDPDWPSPEQWAALHRAVDGRLEVPKALLADCEAGPESVACQDLKRHLHNPYYLGDQAAGTQVSGWLNAWSPRLSAYAVACHSAAHAQAVVNFAREHRLRLVVKGGGHSYQGTSNAPDSLLLWTRPMKNIVLHEHFTPQGTGSAPVPAVSVESGAVWMDVYDAVTTQAGRYVQGGGCATVGVAGLIQSGGFGSFSKGFGNAAASLIEAEVITADGALRTVNQHQERELFWALKGGGGGSFGVVTRLTLRTHDLPDFMGGAEGAIHAASDAAFRRLLGRFFDLYAEALFNPHWGESVNIGADNTLKISMACQGLDNAAAAQAWQAFFAAVRSMPNDYKILGEAGAGSRAARGWWDAQGRRKRGSDSVVFDDRADAAPTHAWWRGDQDQVGAFLYGYESLWLPASLLEASGRARLVTALFEASRATEVELHFNKGLAGAPAAAIAASRDTAMNPAVLTAFALAIIATGGASRYPGLTPTTLNDTAQDGARAVDRATARLRDLAPDTGSYVSESNFFNPQWSKAFWGANYHRLQQVKRRYDPDGLFYVHHGVGSEQWRADGFERV